MYSLYQYNPKALDCERPSRSEVSLQMPLVRDQCKLNFTVFENTQPPIELKSVLC